MDENTANTAVAPAANNLTTGGTPRHRHLTRSSTGSSSSAVTATMSTSTVSNMANNGYTSTNKRSPGAALRRKRNGSSNNVPRKGLNVKVTSIKKNTATKAPSSAIRKGPIRTSRIHLTSNHSRSVRSDATCTVKHRPGRRRKVDASSDQGDVKRQADASSSRSNFKIDIHAFLRRMMDENERNEYIRRVDEHVNKLLDAVKCKEKGSGKRGKGSNQHRSQASQIAETKDKKIIDLSSPDSILSHISNPRVLLNATTFASLPLFYQFKLVKMLPQCDQVITDQGWIKPSASSLTNEFFTKASLGWCENLKEGKFTSDYLQRKRQEVEREKSRLDPWKLKHFEPIWGHKLMSQETSSTCDRAIPRKSLPPLDPVLCHMKTKAAANSFSVTSAPTPSAVASTVASNSETEEETVTAEPEENASSSIEVTDLQSVHQKSVMNKRMGKRRGKTCAGPLSRKLKKLNQENVIASVVPEQFDPSDHQMEEGTSHLIHVSKEDSYITIEDPEQATTYSELTVGNSLSTELASDPGNLDAFSTNTETDEVSFCDSKTRDDEPSECGASDDDAEVDDEDEDDDDGTMESDEYEDACDDENGNKGQVTSGKSYLPSTIASLDGVPASQIPRELQIIPVMSNGSKSCADSPGTTSTSSDYLNGQGVNVITIKSKLLPPQILTNILKKQSIDTSKSDSCPPSSVEKSTQLSLPYKLPEGITILPCTNKDASSLSNSSNTTLNQNGTPHQVPVITRSEAVNSHANQSSSHVWTSNSTDQLLRLPPQITVIPLSSSSSPPTEENGSYDSSNESSDSSDNTDSQANMFTQISMSDECACNLKALVPCSKCGAFCHSDCIGLSTICASCIMRCNSYVPQMQPSNAPSVINECNSPFLYPI